MVDHLSLLLLFVSFSHPIPLLFTHLRWWKLKPRSNRGIQIEPPLSPASSSKSNPFGAAKPREQVLRQRGIDVKSLDAKFEEKAKITKFTTEQEEQIETVRQELTHLETLWRQANEKELPEEVYRVQAEAKRQELKNLMAQFAKKEGISGTSNVTTKSSTTPTTTTTTSRATGMFNSSKNHHGNPEAGGFIPVKASSGGGSSTRKQHYLPAKEGSTTGVDPFSAMSRHRFGKATATN